MSFHNTLRETLCTATKELHAIALFPSEALAGLEWKGENDPVTAHDKRIERRFRDALEPHGIDIVGEEYTNTTRAGNTLLGHVDPIDSTKSFISGAYGSCVAAAVARGDHFLAGGVGDIRSGLVYFMADGKGERIDVMTGRTGPLTGRSPLSKPRIVANDEAAEDTLGMKRRGYSMAVSGGFALNIALVAAGTYDALLAYQRPNGKGPSTWDMAGGLALCQAAGVDVLHPDGRPFKMSDPFAGGLIAVWPDQREKLEKTLREVRSTYR